MQRGKEVELLRYYLAGPQVGWKTTRVSQSADWQEK